jgi:hypothetical protein
VAAYTLWSQTGGGTLAADTASYTLGTEFSADRPVVLTGIWFYSASSAVSLPSQCVIFDLNTGAQVPGTLNTSPSWSGAAGSGWVKCAYNGTVEIGYRGYVVAVLGGGSNWYSTTSPYWGTGGPGVSGAANEPLSARPNTFALNGQSVKHAGASLTFPATSATGTNYWVDVEVSDLAGLAPAYSLYVHALPPDPSGSDLTTAATFGTQFTVSRKCAATAIWQLNSGQGGPSTVGIFKITGTGTGTLLASAATPSGALIGPGTFAWGRIAIPPAVLVPGTNYEVCAYQGSGAAWMPATTSYWTSGSGASGITNGPLSAPNNAGAVNGQGGISSTNAFTFPNNSNSGTNAFVDVEVVPLPQPGIQVVQAAVISGSNPTGTATLGTATTAGNCLVAVMGVGGGSGNLVTAVTLGGAADHWAQLVTIGNLATDAAYAATWADPNCAGGQTAVSVTTNAAGGTVDGYVFEISGLQGTIAALLDQTATLDTHGGSTATPAVGPTSATTQASEIWIGCIVAFSHVISGPVLPWTNMPNIADGNNNVIAGWQITAATGTATYAGTVSSTFCEGTLVTLKAAPGPTLLMASPP